MKDLQIIKFEGLRFQFCEGCGFELLELNNVCTGIESSEETQIKHKLSFIIDKIECNNEIETVNCGSDSTGTLIQILENGEEIAEYVLEYMGE